MAARVLIRHRGELRDVEDLLGALDVERVEATVDRPDLALVGPSCAGELDGLQGCVRVLFDGPEGGTPACEYRVRRPVHPEALRLLLLHALYRGEERRAEARSPVGSEVTLDHEGALRKGTLVDLSAGGGGLHLEAGAALSPGDAVTLTVEGLNETVRVSLPARVQRVASDARLAERGLQAVAIRFERLSAELEEELEWMLFELGETPPLLKGAGPAPVRRRRAPRRSFERKVPAFEDRGLRVLVGRDLSTEGMRVDAEADLAVGTRLEIALYGAPREEPLMLAARVARDDGPGGLALRFEDLDDATRQRIAVILMRLPAIETTRGGVARAAHPGRIVSDRPGASS